MRITKAQLNKLPKIAEGGEAEIFDFATDVVIKIFKPSTNLATKWQKVERLIAGKLPREAITPREAVEIGANFAGYAIQKLANVDPIHQLIKKRYLTLANLNNRDVLTVIARLAKVLDTLHQTGVVVGDISDYNIMISASGRDAYLIDTDSWGLSASLPPDAFTESFTAPEAFAKTGGAKLTRETDLFAFAILAFSTLTRQHPFEGTLKRAPQMSTTERIKRKISVLGAEEITLPQMIPSWAWLSPDLLAKFREIFEKGVRENLTDLLTDQLSSSKLCAKCGVYYYGAFATCPVCDAGAKIFAKPIITTTSATNLPQVTVIFENADVKLMIAPDCYIAKNGEAVHIATGRRVVFPRGREVAFSGDGLTAFIASDTEIQAIWDGGSTRLPRAYKTPWQVVDDCVYLIEPSGTLSRVQITPRGNIATPLAHAHDPIFAISENHFIVISRYPKKAIANVDGRNFEVEYTGKIRDYALKFDPATKCWLFVFKKPNGRMRALIFSRNSVEYDSDVLRFDAAPLSNIAFANGTIFDPGAGKITGTNPAKGTAKEFPCAVVDESSSIHFHGGGFVIVRDDKIYRFG